MHILVKTVRGPYAVNATCFKGAAWLRIVITCRRESDGRYPYNNSTIWFWSFNNARWGSATCGRTDYRVTGYRVEKR